LWVSTFISTWAVSALAPYFGRVQVALGQPALHRAAFHHRRVVVVGDDGVLRVELLGVADHAEHRQRLLFAVDDELGVEDLVAAVLAVGLGEHHQLDVGRVALQAGEGLDQVVDLVVRQRQAEGGVGGLQRRAALAQHVHMGHRLGRLLVEQVGRGLALEGHALGHAVVQQQRAGLQFLGAQRLGAAGQAAHQPALELQAVFGDPLDAVDGQAAVVGDVGGLGGPGRDRAQARHGEHQGALIALRRVAVVQQLGQLGRRLGGQRPVAPDPVHVAGRHPGDARAGGLQARQQRGGAEGGQGVAALEVHQVLGSCGHGIPSVGGGLRRCVRGSPGWR
jgi:hypothetical protein